MNGESSESRAEWSGGVNGGGGGGGETFTFMLLRYFIYLGCFQRKEEKRRKGKNRRERIQFYSFLSIYIYISACLLAESLLKRKKKKKKGGRSTEFVQRLLLVSLSPFFLLDSAAAAASPSVSAAGAAAAAGVVVVLPLPPFAAASHGLAGAVGPLRSSHRTVPRVSPVIIIIVLGLAAAGKAGKASAAAAAGPAGLPYVEGLEVGRDGAGEGLDEEAAGEEDATHGVAPTRPAPALLADDAGIEGKGFVAVELPQLPCLLTAERDD